MYGHWGSFLLWTQNFQFIREPARLPRESLLYPRAIAFEIRAGNEGYRLCQLRKILKSSLVLYQGTTSEAAEILEIDPVLYQGTTSEAAEKLEIEPVLYQGTASAVPQTQQNK
jgi:hypothetical protein